MKYYEKNDERLWSLIIKFEAVIHHLPDTGLIAHFVVWLTLFE